MFLWRVSVEPRVEILDSAQLRIFFYASRKYKRKHWTNSVFLLVLPGIRSCYVEGRVNLGYCCIGIWSWSMGLWAMKEPCEKTIDVDTLSGPARLKGKHWRLVWWAVIGGKSQVVAPKILESRASRKTWDHFLFEYTWGCCSLTLRRRLRIFKLRRVFPMCRICTSVGIPESLAYTSV